MIPLRVDARTWARLARLADERGVKIAALIEAGIASLITPTRRDWVLTLARAGATDREIAERTGETIAYISTQRRNAGIPANRRKP